MKTILISISFFLTMRVSSQQISQISFTSRSEVAWFAFSAGQDALIRVSPDGYVLEWGVEAKAIRYDYYAPNLQPFMGKIEFYENDADSVFRGKLRTIGICSLTYYASYEKDGKPGKIKSIGRLNMDYFGPFDDKLLSGRIKTIGADQLQYYTSFDDENFRGKLKAAGNIPLAYYGMFDDKLFRGKIKSIGAVSYTWYGGADRSDLRGMLKSPTYRHSVGGITYILSY
jgi:hypothetical protein